jgi:hypothetical protein
MTHAGAATDPGIAAWQEPWHETFTQQQQRHTVTGSFNAVTSSGGWFSRGDSSLSAAASGIQSSNGFSSPGYRPSGDPLAAEMDPLRFRPSSLSISPSSQQRSNPGNYYLTQQQLSMSAAGSPPRPYSQSSLSPPQQQQQRDPWTPFAEGSYHGSSPGATSVGFRAGSASGMRPISPSLSGRSYLDAQLSRLSSVSRAGSHSIARGSWTGGRDPPAVASGDSPYAGAQQQQQQQQQEAAAKLLGLQASMGKWKLPDQTLANTSASGRSVQDMGPISPAADVSVEPSGSGRWVAQSPCATAPPGGGLGTWGPHARASPSSLSSAGCTRSPQAAAASAPGGFMPGAYTPAASSMDNGPGFTVEDSAEGVWVPGVSLHRSSRQQPQQQQEVIEEAKELPLGEATLPARISHKQVPVQGAQRPSWSAATTVQGSKPAQSRSSHQQQQQQEGAAGQTSSKGSQPRHFSTGGHVRFIDGEDALLEIGISGAGGYFYGKEPAAGGGKGGGEDRSSAVSGTGAHAGSSIGSPFSYSSYGPPEPQQPVERQPGSLILGDPPLARSNDVVLEMNYSRGSSVGLGGEEQQGPQEALHQYLLGRFKRLQQGRLMQRVLTAWWAIAVEDKVNKEMSAGEMLWPRKGQVWQTPGTTI